MHAIGDGIERVEEKVRLDLRGQMLQARLAEIGGEFRSPQIGAAPDLKLADRKDDDQYAEISDEVFLEFVESPDRQIAGVIVLSRNCVGQIAQYQHARDMQRRERQCRAQVRGDDAPSRMRIQPKTALEAHDEGDEREDDDHAADLPDHRLPVLDFAAQVDDLVDAQVHAEQQAQDHVQRLSGTAYANASMVERSGH